MRTQALGGQGPSLQARVLSLGTLGRSLTFVRLNFLTCMTGNNTCLSGGRTVCRRGRMPATCTQETRGVHPPPHPRCRGPFQGKASGSLLRVTQTWPAAPTTCGPLSELQSCHKDWQEIYPSRLSISFWWGPIDSQLNGGKGCINKSWLPDGGLILAVFSRVVQGFHSGCSSVICGWHASMGP